jgi:ABC-type Mn2+/Zn2+ transport system permease subunit
MLNQFWISLISGIFIGGSAGYIGSLMLHKRMALVAGPLGHLALPGVALALIYNFNVSLGAFPFVIVGIFLIWILEIKTNIPTEALTAVIFAEGVAISFLFLPTEQAETALVGDISTIGLWELFFIILLSSLVIFFTKIIYPKMTLIGISEDLAKIEKINVKKYNLIYLCLVAVVVSLGVGLVGSLLTAALVAIPASTAKNLATSNRSYVILSLLLGIGSSIIGITISQITYLPAGILIIISSGVLFLISLLFQKK